MPASQYNNPATNNATKRKAIIKETIFFIFKIFIITLTQTCHQTRRVRFRWGE